MLSYSHLEEALTIDATVLDTHRHISELMAEKYNFGGYGVPLRVADHEDALIRGVAHALAATTPAVCQETDHALKKTWGVSGEWREMRVIAACADVVGQVTNRLLVGLPLWLGLSLTLHRKTHCNRIDVDFIGFYSRDEEYHRKSKAWSRVVLQTAWLIYMIPDVLKPYVIPIPP